MIRIGIICPSEIAFRRFLPALSKVQGLIFAGVAISTEKEWTGADYNIEREKEKASTFIDKYSGKIFNGYVNMITSDEVDAIYLPLPPALHYHWAKQALLYGKHVFLEKPTTTSLSECEELVSLAKKKKLAIHENYMFAFHNQIQQINEFVANGKIGDVRIYRISFGFPQRAKNDFRYNKKLGGGAILDCGGYTLKYASLLLGDTAKVVYAQSNGLNGFDVDMYGSAALINDTGITAQVAFGMDNDYKCELEVWGSKGSLYSSRVLTAPVGYIPELNISKGIEKESIQLKEDDAFMKSIMYFSECMTNDKKRNINYRLIIKQSNLLEQFLTLNKKTSVIARKGNCKT
ncbi:MAG: Gfo/Idh/MocA family protein [Bacteroidales bacterium]